jgi:gamma-glutamyltranspeptidase/glutathione hydrolase
MFPDCGNSLRKPILLFKVSIKDGNISYIMKNKKLLSIAPLLISLAIGSFLAPGNAFEPVSAKNGMVVSSEHHASEVGRSILKAGGNAVDAAVAMSFALAVTYPGAGNIGGGGFFVLCRKDGAVTTIDFREKAPLGSSPKMFLDETSNIRNNSNHEGILSVGVPGTVAGLELAHGKYGRLSWKELIEPAIKLAEDGFSLSQYLSDNFGYHKKAFLKYPSSAKVFLKADRTNYLPGEIWRQPDLADTLKRIQKHGPADYYEGMTAGLIRDFMRKNGGLITLEDLGKYEAVERKPIHGSYKGYEVYSMGPPSCGGVVLIEMLNILERYNLSRMGHNSAPYLHVLTEAMRLAYLDRARYLGDPDSNPGMPLPLLTSKAYASNLRKLIRMDRSLPSRVDDVNPPQERPHTTHLSVIDSEGNAVSLTLTIEGWFGSKMVVDGAGFLLNNEMGDFNPIPGMTDDRGRIGTEANQIAPGKRMLSNMCPTIVVKDKRPFLIVGSPGGRMIPNMVLQIILNIIDFKMNIAEAIAQPRIHHQWLPDITDYEEGIFLAGSQKLYEALGHKTHLEPDLKRNDATGIAVDQKHRTLHGAPDPRSPEGLAAGY